MKKRIIAAAVALGLLAAGIVGGAALAADDGGKGKGSKLIARVAEILGLEEQTVQNAFDQARGELGDEARENRLAAAVEKGALTQEQADALQAWYDAMPEGLPRMARGGFWSAEKLAMAVEKGVITQEQADALQAWYDARPQDVPEGFGAGPRGKFGHKGRGFRGGKHKSRSWNDGDGAGKDFGSKESKGEHTQ